MSGRDTGSYGCDSSTSTEPESSLTSREEESDITSCTSDENRKENEDNLPWNNDVFEDASLFGMVRPQIQCGKTFWKKNTSQNYQYSTFVISIICISIV